MNSAILVVGGAGYLGARLVPLLLEQGHRVAVSDLLWFGNPFKDVEVIQRDVFDIELPFLERFDQIIFLAGFSNDATAEHEPALCYRQNVTAPAHLARAAKQAGVQRFIYAESCAVYGLSGTPTTEDDETNTNSIYANSKLRGGIEVAFFGDNTFSVIRLRLGTICGYSPRMRFDILLNAMYKTGITEGKVYVSNPMVWRPLLAIGDAALAFSAAVSADKTLGGIFNIRTANFTLGQIAEHVVQHFQRNHHKTLQIVESTVTGISSYMACGKKASNLLNFNPSSSLETCLEELDRCLPSDCNYEDDVFFNAKAMQRIYPTLARR